MHRALGRRLLGAAAAVTAAVAISSPAYAAAPQVVILSPDVAVAAGGSTFVAPFFFAERDATLYHAKMTVQLGDGLTGVTLTSDDPGCPLDVPTTVTCAPPPPGYDLEVGPYGARSQWDIGLAATKAALGKTGKLTVTLTADGIEPVKQTVPVHVVEGVDLVAGKNSYISVKPGADFTTDVQVRNNSKSVTHGVTVLVGADPAYEEKQQYANCFYDGNGAATACTFDQDLQPGATYQITLPYRLRPDAGPYSVGAVFEWLTAGDWDDLLKFLKKIDLTEPGTPGNGGPLSLKKVATSKDFQQTDPDPNNNFQEQSIDVGGKYGPDLAAIGATVSGAVGATVTMPVGVHNNGPRDLWTGVNGYPAAGALITIPDGVTVTSVPDGCGRNTKDLFKGDPSKVQYACFTGSLLDAGKSVTWKFRLKIDKVVAGASGSVQINPESDIPFYRDNNQANNTAAIVLNVSGGATNPGDGHNDVGLPITGPQTALLGAAGAALLAAGAAFFVVSRRRRTRFEA